MQIQESPSKTQVFLFWKNTVGSILVSGSRKSIAAEVDYGGRVRLGQCCFDELHHEALRRVVHPKNAASIRVLEKLGFQVERRDTVMGMDSIVFSLVTHTRIPFPE